MLKQIRRAFCFGLIVLAQFYRFLISNTKPGGSFFFAAHVSYSYYNCNTENCSDVYTDVSEAAQIGFNSGMYLTGNQANQWIVECV